jgi:hypothetical protein
LLGLDKCLPVLERRGGDIPNLTVPDRGPILVYLQRGKYSHKMEIILTSDSYSLGHREY